MDRRGQFSVDAIFAIALLLGVVATLTNLYNGRNQVATWIGTNQEAKLICEKLAATINTVYTNGSTLKLYLELPATIQNHAYTISFDNSKREIIIETSIDATDFTSNAKTACNNITLDDNLDPSKRVKVYWENDRVRLTNI